MDVLGLLAESQRQDKASFLSPQRFRDPADNKARHFAAKLTWADGRSTERALDAEVDPTASERVTYVPQKLFDEICNELQGTEAGQFDDELKRVIFSHVEEADRLQCRDLDALIAYRASEIEAAIEARRERVSRVNRRIVQIERQLLPEHRRTVENRLAASKRELELHDTQRPPLVQSPQGDTSETSRRLLGELGELRRAAAQGEVDLAAEREREAVLKREISIIDRVTTRLTNLEERLREFEAQSIDDFQVLGLKREDVVQIRTSHQPLLDARRTREGELRLVEARLGQEGSSPLDGVESIVAKQRALALQIQEIQGRLDEPQVLYQAYLTTQAGWETKRQALLGAETEADSLRGLETSLATLDQLPSELRQCEDERRTLARDIHGLLTRILSVHQQLYEPIQRIVEQVAIARERFGLQVDAGVVDAGFEGQFLDRFIDRQRRGSFAGVEEGGDRVRRLLSETSFGSEDGSVTFADQILGLLRADHRLPNRPSQRISSQLRQGRSEAELYDFLYGFSYLQVRFGLKMGDRELRLLSPGEKGALLLSFYLLVDKEERPLIIDQPEENLDNQTIVRLLVPSIRCWFRKF